jgi:hypothetical protein
MNVIQVNSVKKWDVPREYADLTDAGSLKIQVWVCDIHNVNQATFKL